MASTDRGSSSSSCCFSMLRDGGCASFLGGSAQKAAGYDFKFPQASGSTTTTEGAEDRKASIDSLSDKEEKADKYDLTPECKSGVTSFPVDAADSALAQRRLDYEKRKADRKKRRCGSSPTKTTSTLDTHGFLSLLPEVNADIAYRFCFNVMGFIAQSVLEATCSTEVSEQQDLPTSPSGYSASGRSSKKKEQVYRCFCNVPYPPNSERPYTSTGRVDPNKFSSDVPKLCKLIFNVCEGAADMPKCKTRFEALSAALVCVMVVDPAQGEFSFHEQLLAYERVVDQIHFRKKPLRPARAILLLRHAESDEDVPPPPRGHLPWQARLEEYEMCIDESLWKFGPVCLKDSMSIHSAFATIASRRILRHHESGGEDSDGSQNSDPPPFYEAEGELERLEETPELEMILSSLAKKEDTDVEEDAFDTRRSLSSERKRSEGTLGMRNPSYQTSTNPQNWMNAMQRGAA